MGKFQDVIALAIGNEVTAQTFYQQVADNTTNPELKTIFAELALEEGKHKVYLEKLLTEDLVSVFFGDAADYKVSESLERPVLSLEMKPVDAITLAMKNEEDAMNLYRKLADQTSDGAKKTLFMELSKMEQMHKSRLEDVYTNMAFVEVW